MTGQDVLPEKRLLIKVATIKKIEYSPLGSELKKKLTLQFKLLKDQTNNVNDNNKEGGDNNKKEDDNREEDMSGESNRPMQ